MGDTTAPEWTRDPVTAAERRPIWPDCAEDFDADDRVEYKDMKRWRYDDPRPQSGYVLAGRYQNDADWHLRFECVRCGLGKVLGVPTGGDKYQQIRFSCPACRKVTYHNPAGRAGKYLTLHE